MDDLAPHPAAPGGWPALESSGGPDEPEPSAPRGAAPRRVDGPVHPFGSDRTPRSPSGPAVPAGPVASLLAYGTSRPLVNVLLYALAAEANPRFGWLDVRGPGDPPSAWDPVRLGWIDRNQSWTADPDQEFLPDDPRANAALFHTARSDGSADGATSLSDLFRLPPALQRALAAIATGPEPSVLAVANSDRISEEIPAPAVASILASLRSMRCALFAGFVGDRPATADLFSNVVRIEGADPARWPEAEVVFERIDGCAAERLVRGAAPGELPFLERAFRRASA